MDNKMALKVRHLSTSDMTNLGLERARRSRGNTRRLMTMVNNWQDMTKVEEEEADRQRL